MNFHANLEQSCLRCVRQAKFVFAFLLARQLRLVCVLAIAVSPVLGDDTTEGLAFFENEVRPLLIKECHQCHGDRKQESGLRLDSKAAILNGGESGPAIVANSPGESLLLHVVQYEGDIQMPPEDKLPDRSIDVIRRWIELGAPYPGDEIADDSGANGPTIRRGEITEEDREFWSFQPLANPRPPRVQNAAWTKTPIDRFVLARLEQADLQPAAPASRRTLLRRVTFDLTGLPPTPLEVRSFVEDRHPDAYARVVERLLASPAYGERWGRHWLDVVRYADTAGETADYPLPEAYRYRDYVIDAFNADKPYDQFVREQVAGDILARRGLQDGASERSKQRELYAERATATGFVALSRRFGYDSEHYHHMTIQDTIDTLGQSVLGLSLGCARCHPHKFDPISSEDYYSLYGIFASTRYAFPGSEEKQKFRSYLPLVPAGEAESMRLRFEERVAAIENRLRELGDNVTSFSLGSVDDIDGDFQLQQRAAGGSYGLPVDPWWHRGNVSIQSDSQSPFTHAVRKGTLGARLAGDAEDNELWQSFEPPLNEAVLISGDADEASAALSELHFAFDFRVTADSPRTGEYVISLGRAIDGPSAFEFSIGKVQAKRFEIAVAVNDQPKLSTLLAVDSWYHLRLLLNLQDRTFVGAVSTKKVPANNSHDAIESLEIPLTKTSDQWDGVVGSFSIKSRTANMPDHLSKPSTLGAAIQFDESKAGTEQAAESKATNETAAGIVKPTLDVDNLILRRTAIAAWPQLEQKQADPKHARTNAEALDESAKKALRASLRDELAAMIDAGPYPQVYGVSEGYQHDERIQRRGEPSRPGDSVPRRWLEVLDDQQRRVESGSGRLELADWLTRDNSLTARVIANRIWQHHFGHGLVRTENDFGRRGELPSHPRLLEYLASRLVDGGYSIKRLHREILLSSTYQLSGQFDAKAAQVDPDARLLWRVRSRRLDAESIRDSIWALSGRLDRSRGQRHPFPPAATSGYTQHVPFRAVYPSDRRSVYLMVQRTKRHPFLSLFDGPDPNASTAKRKTTTVPTQALFFMNAPQVHQQAIEFGRRIWFSAEDDPTRVDHGFQFAFGRPATEREVSRSVEFINRYRRALSGKTDAERESTTFAAFARTLFASNEFVYVD